jgi:hypothetical protein
VSNGRVWYFAYGSNMETATLRGRRGIEPLCALGARAAGWRLVFDKPPLVPVGEAFANIVPDRVTPCWESSTSSPRPTGSTSS